MTPFRILVTDPLHSKGIETLDEAGAEVTVETDRTEDQLRELIKDYDALIVRSGTQVTAELMEAGDRLQVVGRAGVGVNNIDLDAATAAGMTVLNVPDANTVSAAEHTWALILSVLRHIPQAHASLQRGAWDRSSFLGTTVHSKTLGIVGLGRIGSEVARRARGWGVELIGYDPFVQEERAEALGIQMMELDQLLAKADIVTVHTPLNDHTRGLIDAQRLSLMKDDAVIVNCARGGIIDEEALHEALASSRLAGAGLDVYESEPPDGSPLLDVSNLVTTPHLGASTVEAQALNAVTISQDVIGVLSGQPPRNPVNLPSVAPEAWDQIQAYLDLAHMLGQLAASLGPQAVKQVTVRTEGDLAPGNGKAPQRLVANAALAGLLDEALEDRVNVINAQAVARRRRIDVEVTRRERAGDTTQISIDVSGEGETFSAAGRITAEGDVHLTKLWEFPIELTPASIMLLTRHQDQPGMVGQVGTLLGEQQINIAGMQVGRHTVGGQSVMVLTVDNPVPQELMASLRSVHGVDGAWMVDLSHSPGTLS